MEGTTVFTHGLFAAGLRRGEPITIDGVYDVTRLGRIICIIESLEVSNLTGK